MLTPKDIDEIFTFHPVQPGQGEKYEELRSLAKQMARKILELVPESAERTIAIRHLQETVMFANAAIAIHTGKNDGIFDNTLVEDATGSKDPGTVWDK